MPLPAMAAAPMSATAASQASMLERARAVMRASNATLIDRARADNPSVVIPKGAEDWDPPKLHALIDNQDPVLHPAAQPLSRSSPLPHFAALFLTGRLLLRSRRPHRPAALREPAGRAAPPRPRARPKTHRS